MRGGIRLDLGIWILRRPLRIKQTSSEAFWLSNDSLTVQIHPVGAEIVLLTKTSDSIEKDIVRLALTINRR